MKILFIGECMAEFRQGEAGVWHQAFAGDVFNTAVYMKRISEECEVAFASVLGRDMFSQDLRHYCEQSRLDTRWLKSHESRSCGVYFIQTDTAGERQFTYYRENSAARTLLDTFSDNDFSAIAEQVDWVFLSGISLAILSANDRSRLLEKLTDLRRQGVKLVFDTNFRPVLWESRDKAKTDIYAFMESCDLVFAGREDMASLLGREDITSQEVADLLAPLCIPELVIKAGADHVMRLTQSERQHFPVEPVGSVVDTTAAGDSFNAGYLSALLAGQPPEQRVAKGQTLAASVIQHPGAIIPVNVTPAVSSVHT
ncbi:2-dehydro-3-deoxygluconokinase [Saliniradius amylolyticus]|uniref:2-dehydro-3-deoxygluconokinase n=1 Tax=Saliniradius amylolyticus TaxID=2183582 RepID=A0A2S2E5W6_9ALTE|nr:sugar kinase [Saliniradius amylolyticus]AWL13048.1 2-dehydro-3-deoxygluconokinase [Saliniradius amylolyticus]